MPDRCLLPTFLIIGAGKSGTTSLWSYLNQHPQIGMSAIKEPSFFSVDDIHARGLDWYSRLYAGHEGAAARGEASNSYSAMDTYPRTIDRIADTLDEPKFIYIVRHPRDRTESDWMQRVKTTPIAFSDFLRTDSLYADKNAYLRTYERYAERFGQDHVLVLLYDDLVRNSASLLRQLCNFLKVDPDFEFDHGSWHGRSAEGRAFRFGLGKLRSTKLYTDLSLVVPECVKSRLREALSRPINVTRPAWSREDMDWFRLRYEAQTRAFLRKVGHDPNTWIWD